MKKRYFFVLIAIVIVIVVAMIVRCSVKTNNKTLNTDISEKTTNEMSNSSGEKESSIELEEEKEMAKLENEVVNNSSFSSQSSSLENTTERETEEIETIIGTDAYDKEELLITGGSGETDSNQGGLFNNGSGSSNKPKAKDAEETIAESIPEGFSDDDDLGRKKTLFEIVQKDDKYTYEYYLNELSAEEKQMIYDSAPSPQDFLNWVSKIREEYNEERDKNITNIEDGINF